MIKNLGYPVKETKVKEDRNDVLTALENGDISVDEAINKLKY